MNTTSEPLNNRILVIDDNPSIHDDFRKILGASGAKNHSLEESESAVFGEAPKRTLEAAFEIESAFQGKEGLEKVQQAMEAGRPYAMAFVDVRMPPGWDGVETIGHIWKVYPDLQVVICTAYSDYSWADITKNLGTSDNLVILKKPFDNIEVFQLAHALTKKWYLKQQADLKLEHLDKLVNLRTQELQTTNQKLEREIAERVKADASLRRLEERFSKAFAANPLPMIIYTFDGERCIDVNRQFLKMFNYQPKEVIDQPLADLQIAAAPEKWAAFRTQLRKSRSVHNLNCACRTKSGKTRDALLWAELLNVGAEPCVLLIIEDVTERRLLENQLHQAQKMEAIGQLATGIAHDFNNILTVIQGHVELLLMSANFEQKAAKSLEQVSRASSRAAELTRQLLAFCRKQAGQPQVLDLNKQFQSIKGMLGRLLGEQIQLQCDFAQDLPSVFADPSNIEQIIKNLATNACEAMPRGGTLTITATSVQIDESHSNVYSDARAGAHVCLSISDTGCGIKPDALPRIFEPFFTTKQLGKGAGLGLATVYGLVKQLNGWVEVDSEVDKGSTFKVYLPAHGAAEPAQTAETARIAEPARTAETPKKAQPTILVVEDEDALRELTCRVVRNAGYQVIAAADGAEALKAWKENQSKIDLLFTDIVMPNGISGRELARKLRAEKSDLKIFFTSGYSAELAAKDSLLAEGHNFLAKPFSPKVLLQALSECLSGTGSQFSPGRENATARMPDPAGLRR